jgi:dihydrofolate synthase/folylpolyglutamate synthase
VLVDGAINRESTQHICDLVRHYPAKRIYAIVGVPKPKDLEGVCSEVAKVADKIVLTEVSVPNLTWYDDASRVASQYSSNVQFIPSATDAFASVMRQVQPDEGILLLGTQSFVGSALQFWDVDTCNIW